MEPSRNHVMTIARKPEWLRKRVCPAEEQSATLKLLQELNLTTVCQQALCPNIYECFSCSRATFLILGSRCTRRCSFCNVEKNIPLSVDSSEVERVAAAVTALKLKHVVITSPTRDDLPDGGAAIYAATVVAIRKTSPATGVELLIPDFRGNLSSLLTIIASHPDIVGHNIETVPRLYHVRNGADYRRSLNVIKMLASLSPEIRTKSGVMLGLGETREEVLQVLQDLRRHGCDYLTLGQYLAPSRNHFQVQEYIPPDIFDELKEVASELGFRHVESGPFVRSSYHAGRYDQ